MEPDYTNSNNTTKSQPLAEKVISRLSSTLHHIGSTPTSRPNPSTTSQTTGTLPTTMQAWRKHTNNPRPVWDTIPVPTCPPTGYLVKLLASGVCHSDDGLLQFRTCPPHFEDKYTLGHEGCGVVVQVGDDVEDGEAGEDFYAAGGKVHAVGDRVALLAVPGCGLSKCEECQRGLPQLCVSGKRHGLGQDGYYAPYVAVDRRVAVALPSGVSPAVAAVATDAVLTSYHGVMRRAKVQTHETVFLFGLGGLGFNALQILIHAVGARVIVSDIRQDTLEEAAALGIPREDIVPAGTSVQQFIKEAGLYERIDTVLDFVGKEQTWADGQAIVRPGSKILCVGLLDSHTTVNMLDGARKRLSFLFTYGGQYRDLVECLDLIAQGHITPRVETGRLEDFPRALEDLSNGKIKARIALLHD